MNIKSIVLAIALAPMAVSAFAVTPVVAPTLSVDHGKATKKNAFDNIATTGFASDIKNKTNYYDVGATLKLLTASNVTFEFIGKEADFTNVLTFNGASVFNNTVAKGYTQTFNNVAAGVLNFGFLSNNAGSIYANGSKHIAFMTNSSDTSALALFNDGYGDKDFDDMGVKITLSSVSAVPEPETYALLLAGLGLMGTIVRRRKAKQA